MTYIYSVGVLLYHLNVSTDDNTKCSFIHPLTVRKVLFAWLVSVVVNFGIKFVSNSKYQLHAYLLLMNCKCTNYKCTVQLASC